ncbi:MAG: hypothetical protein A3H57_00005 [Candidatus Taylorbacteria bacterium RIFCSPLOWO2_02_FULL_43_11]|uniref:NodB homology domain-containing protein n=1 Tax=Candidatus Taylorbacteria bacterium RIFCSPHIGHO2_02_FULL_43_32b TaxID=1802306 RepID=A0A1G2MLU1_9BACT|nr:MAG: hypothetical protein A2743_02265 [Candidatus Taylorbacteria bacterium RIFCSPHIGHO2_01_FULL_43_47]OHA24179.1 MAG: hypothetical protein A3C72_03530 [Candidatus Taylorbacteria bacterium RIFCSPHIGHO2_02_FULL_43_32b]OHA31227.1 MAG: hypothetical protein A3B08_00635 [Candidatus Taylorbacteria bacterium RIFCSPLOWO2_01_FULL_43_44]OHA37634.1 MAG: hypothetical protein A3H57_00005 [Candidatus Taylorbacteria bacterium RIFCSPLOWO2_02_FULL_43_11]
MYFIITVDIEADNQWKENPPSTIQNVYELPKFQALCLRYGFKPVYLVTYEVLNDEKAVSMLKSWQDNGSAEIGAHLHPWTTPPTANADKFKRFPSELGSDELKEKIVNLTSKIKESFGLWPASYRAGRWGFDMRQAQILAELSYKVDCSITPQIDWKGKGNNPGSSGPDWRFEDLRPRTIEAGNKKILEVPMTIINTGVLAKFTLLNRLLLKYPRNIFCRAIKKLFLKPLWLRVFPETVRGDWNSIIRSAKKRKLPVIEFMIHSSELSAGQSPYAKTEESVERLYKNLELLFSAVNKAGIENLTLREFEEHYSMSK